MKINHVLIKLRYTILTISLFLMAYSLQAQNQKVSITTKQNTVLSAFEELEKQTQMTIAYNEQLIDINKTLSVNLSQVTLSEALNTILKDTKLTYIIKGKQIIIIPDNKPKQQITKKYSGVILDINKDAIIGASVAIKGTTIGTLSDLNGAFEIEAPIGSTLTISYIGYLPQEVKVENQTTLNFILKENERTLEEVVVVGYGTQKKETLSGSVAILSSENLVTTKTENLINNIQGKIPGLLIRQQTGEPGVFDNMVSIRGFGNPLIVIDGVPRDGVSDLAQLNSNDIESISVLKDASAAIFGMNAANGVIIVTTKKGEAGKTKVSYSGLFGMKSATGIERMVDAYTYRVIANEMQRNIGAMPLYNDDILQKYKNNEPGYNDNDWINMFMYDRVFQQQHNITVQGGSDKVKYFSSFGYTEDNGLLRSDIQYYRRYNFRTAITSELTRGLTLGVYVSGRLDKTQTPREDFLWTYKTLVANDRGIGYHTIANENHLSAIGPENKNPYALVDPNIDGYRQRRNFQYQSNVELTYKAPFAKGLTFSVLGAYDGWEGNNSMLQKSYKLYDYYTDAFVLDFGNDSYSSEIGLYNRIHAKGQVNYEHKFWQKHNFNILFATELTSTRSDYLGASRKYLDIYTHDIIDQGSPTSATNYGNRAFTRMAAYLGRLNYDFAGKYLFEAAARYDGSYRYAPSKRWAFFPSLSAGWRISEEKFIADNLPFINNLKLRLSHGKSGMDAGNAFEYIAGYSGVQSRGYVFSDNELTVGMVAPGIVNDNLTWITSTINNVGLDVDLWNSKLSFTADLFKRKNTGLLATRIQSVPDILGAYFPQENINSNMDQGVEFSVTHKGNIGKDFKYTLMANASYSRTKTLHDERAEFTSSWDRWKSGKGNRNDGYMWLYEYDGQYTSLQQYETAPLMGGSQGNSKMLPGSYALKDLNGDGIINESDMTSDHWAFGKVNPPIQYGFTISAIYKSFDLNILLQGASGYTIYYDNSDVWGYGINPTLPERFLDRWHTLNPTDDPYNPSTIWVEGSYPALRTNASNTTDRYYPIDVWRPNATYLRVKSVELGYNLPSPICHKLGLADLRLYVNGFNLYTFCNEKLKYADPERQEKDWNADLTYPLMKSFNVGLNVNF